MVEYYDARVLFDHLPVASDELRLRKGETVEVRVDHSADREQGWLHGTDIRGQHGMLPENYVQRLVGKTLLGNTTESKHAALETTSNSSGIIDPTPGGDRVVCTPKNGEQQDVAGDKSPHSAHSAPTLYGSSGNSNEKTPDGAGDEESSSALRSAAGLGCPADSTYHLPNNDPAAYDDDERDSPHELSSMVSKSSGLVHDLREGGPASCSRPIIVEEGRTAQGPFLARASPRKKRQCEISAIGPETFVKLENTVSCSIQ